MSVTHRDKMLCVGPGKQGEEEEEQEEESKKAFLTSIPRDANLLQDYAAIAQLMKELDRQVETLTTNVNQIIETAPAHDGLAALWEEYVKASSTTVAANSSQHRVKRESAGVSNNDTAMEPLRLGDESESLNDPIIFL
jgi:hypothetical protein